MSCNAKYYIMFNKMRSMNDSMDTYSDANGCSAVTTFNVKFYACQVLCVG